MVYVGINFKNNNYLSFNCKNITMDETTISIFEIADLGNTNCTIDKCTIKSIDIRDLGATN